MLHSCRQHHLASYLFFRPVKFEPLHLFLDKYLLQGVDRVQHVVVAHQTHSRLAISHLVQPKVLLVELAE